MPPHPMRLPWVWLFAAERPAAPRMAMIEMRTEKREAHQGVAHMWSWGAFVLLGDPG